jgi:hypothetical protein
VTQLGAVVLAILMRRALTADEYPRAVTELVNMATERLSIGHKSSTALRLWLQQALQLQSRALFPSAVDAERAYVSLISDVSDRRAGAVTIQEAIRQLAGEEDMLLDDAAGSSAAADAKAYDAAPAPDARRAPPAHGLSAPRRTPETSDSAPRRSGFTFLRAVLPHFRAN